MRYLQFINIVLIDIILLVVSKGKSGLPVGPSKQLLLILRSGMLRTIWLLRFSKTYKAKFRRVIITLSFSLSHSLFIYFSRTHIELQ